MIAARLGQLSGKSRLLIGEETYRRLARCCRAAPLGKQLLKNVKNPVAVYRVLDLTCRVAPVPAKNGQDENRP